MSFVSPNRGNLPLNNETEILMDRARDIIYKGDNLREDQRMIIEDLISLVERQQLFIKSQSRSLTASTELIKSQRSSGEKQFFVSEGHNCNVYLFDNNLQDWVLWNANVIMNEEKKNVETSLPSTPIKKLFSESVLHNIRIEDDTLIISDIKSGEDLYSLPLNSSFQLTMLQSTFTSLMFHRKSDDDEKNTVQIKSENMDEGIIGLKFVTATTASSFQMNFRRIMQPILEKSVQNSMMKSPLPLSPPSAPPKPIKFASPKMSIRKRNQKARISITNGSLEEDSKQNKHDLPPGLFELNAIPYSIDRPEFNYQLHKQLESLEASKLYSSNILSVIQEFYDLNGKLTTIGNKVAESLDRTELAKALEGLMDDTLGSFDKVKLDIPDDPFGAIMHEFAEIFRESGKSREMFMHVLKFGFLNPISETLNTEFTITQNLLKNMNAAEKLFEASLQSSVSAKGSLSAEKLKELDNENTNKRIAYELSRFDLISQINKLSSLIKMQIIDSSCNFVYAYIGYLNNCLDICKAMINPMQKLHIGLANVKSKIQETDIFLSEHRTNVEFQTSRESLPSLGVIPGSSLEEIVGKITLQGYLFKLSSGFVKDWQRRWFVIAQGKLFYLRGPKDIETELVADLMLSNFRESRDVAGRRWVFELNSPGRMNYMLQADGPESLKIWLQALRNTTENLLIANNIEDSTVSEDTTSWDPTTQAPVSPQKNIKSELQSRLTKILALNSVCADCLAANPTWAVLNLGIIICLECSGIHRGLGVHISKVRSMTLDSWDENHILLFEQMGNKKSNLILEANVPESRSRPSLADDSGVEGREAFIRSKYEFHAFITDPYMDTKGANAMLVEAVSNGKVFDILVALAHGAEINKKYPKYNDGTVLHVAASCGHSVVVDLLILNGGSLDVLDNRTTTPLEAAMLSNQVHIIELITKRLDEMGR